MPTTPRQLVTNFCYAYQEMDIGTLADLLHPDFKMLLLSETLDDWGFAQDFHFDYSTAMGIHTNMFRGDPGMDSSGNPVHPIDHIVVDLFEPLAAWALISEEDSDFGDSGGFMSPHMINIQFFDASFAHKFEIQQQVVFYIKSVTDGGSPDYKILGIRPLPLYAKTDNASWDGLLAMYR